MKTTPIFLMLTIVIGSLFSSCNQDPDGDDGAGVLPDLIFSYSVTGEINQSGNWESPENNNELGGHDYGVICSHSNSQNGLSIVGTSPDFSFSVFATVNTPAVGNYTVNNASFSNGSEGFIDNASGTLSIDDITVNFTSVGQTFYTASGSFNVQIQDGLTPPSSIAFEGDFEGLNITSGS